MDDLISSSYNNFAISRRESDGWVNLTQMCKANGVKFNDFLRLKSTKAYISSMAADTGKPVSEIIEVKKGEILNYKVVGEILKSLFCWLSGSALSFIGGAMPISLF